MANPKRAPTQSTVLAFPQFYRRLEADIPPSHRPKVLVVEIKSEHLDLSQVTVDMTLVDLRA